MSTAPASRPPPGRRRRARGRHRPIGAALVLACLWLLGALPAAAQPAAPAAPAGRLDLEVADMTGVLLPGGDLRIDAVVANRGSARAADLRLVVNLHRRVTSRFEYQQAVDEGRVGGVTAAFSVDVDPVAAGGLRPVLLSRSAAELGFARPADKYGVYPLQLRLEQEDAVIAEVFTSLVLTPEDIEQPLVVATLVPLDAPVALLADGGVIAERLENEVASRGRLTDLVAAVEAHGDAAATLAPSGLLLEQLAALATGQGAPAPDGRTDGGGRAVAARAAAFLEQVRGVAGRPGTSTVALAYGPADLVALVRGGMGPEAARHISVGRATVENLTGVRPERGMLWPPAGLDQATLVEVLGAGVDAVVLGEPYLDIPPDRPLRFSPAPVRRLRTPAGLTLPVLVPDPWLEETLAEPDRDAGAPLAAQRVLAETAVVFFERPFAEDPRGLLLAPPQLWNPPPGMAAALLGGLASAPWVRTAGVAELGAALAPDDEPVRLDYPARARAAELDPEYVAALREARRLLGSLASVTVEDNRPSTFDRLLLAAASVHYRPLARRPEGRALASAVVTAGRDLARAVTVAEDVPVTLTDIRGRVPLALRSDATVPLQVQVRLSGARFRFPGGAAQQLLLQPGTTTTVTFLVEALTPGGTYPISVTVEDAEGGLVLARGTVVVRSTAYSVTALLLTGGAAVFLLVWWIRDAHRRLRGAGEERRSRARTPAGV